MILNATPSALSPAVSPTPTLARSRLVPPRTMGSLFTRSEDRASRSPWAPSVGVVPSHSSVRLEALFPLAVRSHPRESPPVTGRCSPGFLPSSSFSPSNLGASARPDLAVRTRPLPRRVRSATSEDRHAAEAPRQPLASGGASRRRAPLQPRRWTPARCGLDLAASRRRACSRDLLYTVRTVHLGLQSFQVFEESTISRDRHLVQGSPASSSTSQLRDPA